MRMQLIVFGVWMAVSAPVLAETLNRDSTMADFAAAPEDERSLVVVRAAKVAARAPDGGMAAAAMYVKIRSCLDAYLKPEKLASKAENALADQSLKLVDAMALCATID